MKIKKILSFLVLLIASALPFFNNYCIAAEEGSDTFNIKKWLQINKTGPGVGYTYFKLEGSCANISPVACYLITVIQYLTGIVGTMCFAVIVLGGLYLMASRGSENELQKGKDIITYAIIGLVISLSAYIITTFVQSIFFP